MMMTQQGEKAGVQTNPDLIRIVHCTNTTSVFRQYKNRPLSVTSR